MVIRHDMILIHIVGFDMILTHNDILKRELSGCTTVNALQR